MRRVNSEKRHEPMRPTYVGREVITMANAKKIQLHCGEYNGRVVYNRTNKGHIKLAAYTVANRKEHMN